MRITGKLFIQKNQLLLGEVIAKKTQQLEYLKATKPESHRFEMVKNELQWLNAKDKAIGRARSLNSARAIRQLERGPLTNHALDDTIRYFNLGPW